MPRPGPRPYECVRRAWHSDRHQPIRGSLIQEIFRIVNEIHSSATKKNKEWQEKLPVVVLKAEEIMYSKANSEAEYVNVNTLWERANDAINTIIRRDESTETGELLQPCIEAALHLGCTPRRSSRSQRNITPRCYLNPEKPEAMSISLSNSENKIQGNHATNCSLFLPQTSNFFTTNVSDHSKLPFSPHTFSPTINHQSMPKEPNSSTTTPFSVYPLYYYGNNNNNNNKFQFQQDSNFKPSCKSNSHLIKTDKKVGMGKHSTCGQDASNVTSQACPLYFSGTPHGNGCDLSLRLAPLAVPSLGGENQNSCPKRVKDGGSLGTCKVGSKCDDMFSQCDRDFSFFSKPNDHDMPDCSSAKWSYMTQNLNVETTLGKRKAAISHVSAEDMQFCWPLKVPFKQFYGRINDSDQ